MDRPRLLRRVKQIWPVVVLVIGVGYFLNPYFDGASEVFCPYVARYLWIPLALWRLVAPVVFVVHCRYSIFVLLRRGSLRYKVIMMIPLLLLPIMWRVTYPPGITWTDRRIDAFPIGGWARVMWAGGPSRVQDEALELLDASSSVIPPKSQWPPAIGVLGEYVKIDKDANTVDVYIPRRYNIDDQFGFLIRDSSSPAPHIGEAPREDAHRIWRLADGIYLYERR